MKSIKSFFKRYWAVLRRPSVHYSLGALTLGGFIAGIIFWAVSTRRWRPPTPRHSASPAMRWKTTCSWRSRTPSTTATAPACERPARIATCHTSGPTRSRARCRPPRKSGARSSAPSAPARNSSRNAASWPSTNGHGSRRTTRWSAATVTISTTWTLPGRASAQRSSTPPPWPAARRPASTATKASPTNCRTCEGAGLVTGRSAQKPGSGQVFHIRRSSVTPRWPWYLPPRSR